jgi:putative endonuclease
MSNHSRTLYIGMTSDLEARVGQHKERRFQGFTAKYNCTKLVYFEEFIEVTQAIEWEKRLKGWLRAKKIALIEEQNPSWDDLAAGWNVEFGNSPQASECHPEGTPEVSSREANHARSFGSTLRMTTHGLNSGGNP